MLHTGETLASILRGIDLGSPVAELDDLLETARVETSAFSDILNDRVDLVPGTKGSGKSALYRIFVDFLPDLLLKQRKVVVAHGVRVAGDEVFQVFQDRFGRLDESDFVNFWCIYLVSLTQEHFIQDTKFAPYLKDCKREIDAFKSACRVAKIPELGKPKPVREVIDWALNAVLSRIRPRAKFKLYEGTIEFDLLGDPVTAQAPSRKTHRDPLPQYVAQVKDTLEAILTRSDLHLWLLIDRLDEIFPRRSQLETRALRGLLRTLQIFQSPRIRIKIFLRDDILEQVTTETKGFTALTHVTARRADTLQWSEEQILDLVVNRFFASSVLCDYLNVDREHLNASRRHREKAFGLVFPPTVHRGANQSSTLRWIYNHTKDGRDVVTPRDVIELLTRAKQRQQDEFEANPSGQTDHLIESSAIQYGLAQLSHYKRDSLLKAEFPHFWPHIEKLRNGKSEYTERGLTRILGKDAFRIAEDLMGIGVLSDSKRKGERTFKIPFLYREGLSVTQGFVER